MTTSAACCQLAPVSHDYKSQGEYETIASLKTYVVGPKDATKGIVMAYDIFGISSQTLQGADRLAAETGAIVLVPDFFEGKGLGHDLIPSDTEEKKQKVQAFFAATALFPDNLPKLFAIRKAMSDLYPAAEQNWGIFGLCWGGKLTVLACGEGNEGAGRRFVASGTAHPGLLDEKDAKAQTAPHLLQASKDEPADLVAKYKEIMGHRAEVTTYETMHHGWMGARADLKDEANIAQYQKGYSQAAVFFSKHLS